MFLKPEQQLERCKRIVRQRVDPHIHPSIAQLAVESFDIPGEPMPTDEFFEKLNRGDIDFKPFTLGGEWGTTWGTVWFRLTGTVPAGYPKGKPLELILDLGWYPHSCGGHIEGLVYRADGTAIKAVHPLNYWVPFMDAEGNAQVPVAEDGSFTLYLEAASNPLLLGVPPFIETELGDHATGKPDEPYVFKSADLAEFDERYENYSVDLDVVSSLMEFADKQSPRYWQLAKALQRSLNAYDERTPESVEAARAALAGVLAKPANASAMNDAKCIVANVWNSDTGGDWKVSLWQNGAKVGDMTRISTCDYWAYAYHVLYFSKSVGSTWGKKLDHFYYGRLTSGTPETADFEIVVEDGMGNTYRTSKLQTDFIGF